MTEPLYKEEQRVAPWFMTLILGLGLILMMVLFLFAPPHNRTMLSICIIFAVMMFLLLIFNKMNLEIYSDQMRAGFKVFTKSVKFSDVTGMEPTIIRFNNCIGIHTDMKGNWIVSAHSGSGLKLKLKNGTDFIISANNPETLISVISPLLSK
jgi:hypothetical protein